MTPTARRAGGRGETIRFTCVKTALGWALVAATTRGICMTALGDDKAPLEADLRRRFPAALIWPADSQLSSWAERIVRFVTDPREQIDLPLDIRGTAFQARVWKALQKVPPGKTATYTEIAAALGQPKAVRAVAAACAANKLALLVPCHRIVRRDGDLAGYRWGVERKRRLLAAEQATAGAVEAAE
jgi:AraC family transcriptional regulator, regulatory protein of adaptative response / methylated-DNA-[protein]-cysteine methyltransferase